MTFLLSSIVRPDLVRLPEILPCGSILLVELPAPNGIATSFEVGGDVLLLEVEVSVGVIDVEDGAWFEGMEESDQLSAKEKMKAKTGGDRRRTSSLHASRESSSCVLSYSCSSVFG